MSLMEAAMPSDHLDVPTKALVIFVLALASWALCIGAYRLLFG